MEWNAFEIVRLVWDTFWLVLMFLGLRHFCKRCVYFFCV